MKVLKTTFEEFKESNISVLLYLNEEEKSSDQDYWFKPKEVRFQDFIEDVDLWIKNAELQKVKPQTCHDEVTHMDSVSVVSRSKASKAGSGRSGASSASSARLKEEATRAALEAKAATLKQKQALVLKEAQLQAEKEELEIQTALAEANAKIKVYEGYDAQEKGNAMNEYADGTHAQYTPVKKESRRGEAETSHQQNLQRYDKLPDISLPSYGAKPKVLKVEESGVNASGISQYQSDSTKDLYKVLKQQTDMTEMLVKHQLTLWTSGRFSRHLSIQWTLKQTTVQISCTSWNNILEVSHVI